MVAPRERSCRPFSRGRDKLLRGWEGPSPKCAKFLRVFKRDTHFRKRFFAQRLRRFGIELFTVVRVDDALTVTAHALRDTLIVRDISNLIRVDLERRNRHDPTRELAHEQRFFCTVIFVLFESLARDQHQRTRVARECRFDLPSVHEHDRVLTERYAVF